MNSALLIFYWELGADIVERQKNAAWGSGFLKQLSTDLMAEFPDMTGFSLNNIQYIKRWYLFYAESFTNCGTGCATIGKQAVAQFPELPITPNVEQPAPYLQSQLVSDLVQIPWGHNRAIVSKCADVEEALYYVRQTVEHNWSRSVLVHQVESGLYRREGKAITNFAATLPTPQSDLAQ